MERNNRKVAIITGAIGQDGSFMAELLASKGYEVHGFIKKGSDDEKTRWMLSLVPGIKLYRFDMLDKSMLESWIRMINPTEIYNFAGYSNVFSAWENTDLIFEINARLPQYILEIIIGFNKSIRFFQASSCLVFGRDQTGIQNESTCPNPIYPYGITKNYADNLVKEYRNTFGLFACSGIFFPHESERRGDNFFSKKIVNGVVGIKNGTQKTIKVGNLDAFRDYGYARDYMEAAYLMLNAEKPNDYVIGTGKLISMADFADKCFKYVGLDMESHLEIDGSLYRKVDTCAMCCDATKIKNDLGWKPTTDIDTMIGIMINNTINKQKK